MKIEELDLDVRQYNMLKRAGIDTTEDFINYPDKEQLKKLTGRTYGVMEELLRTGTISDENISAPAKPDLPIPQTDAEEIAESFNYALLSAELGDYLRHKEEQLKNEYMSFTANCGRIFAEAQEKLAKHGFGENNGVFEKWITSMGFAKRSVYRMIQIYEYRSCQIGTNEGQALFDALPKTLQADISAPSAPPELVEQVMNGDITTHKEYIALKKQLEEQTDRADKATAENIRLKSENDDLSYRYDEDTREINELSDQITDLEKQIRELESRPREVAVDVDELNRRVEKVSIELQNQTARQIAAEREDFAQKLNRMEDENEELRAELEKAKAKAGKGDDKTKTYLIRMTMDELCELIEAVSEPYLKEILKKAQVLRV